ncbi:hypothetical protein E2C01_003273 [Portunus trituberculatus]|uniref:Uncharacterized protein n=1 Tax=Portunus trituberculatus TaxID=210409 RepID=A0A5B7CNA1_PORTR|nr:hypothetical protein [Portunus trituberculatus]
MNVEITSRRRSSRMGSRASYSATHRYSSHVFDFGDDLTTFISITILDSGSRSGITTLLTIFWWLSAKWSRNTGFVKVPIATHDH